MRDGLDFEWKVVEENEQRKVYFKQVRAVSAKIGIPENKKVVLGGKYRMDYQQPESPEGIIVYHMPKALRFEFNSVTIADLSSASLVANVQAESVKGLTNLKIVRSQARIEKQQGAGDIVIQQVILDMTSKSGVSVCFGFKEKYVNSSFESVTESLFHGN